VEDYLFNNALDLLNKSIGIHTILGYTVSMKKWFADTVITCRTKKPAKIANEKSAQKALKHSRIMLLCTAMILCRTLALFAQSEAVPDSGFAPFVTELKAENRNNLIRLSWIDSRDARGPVYIFRSARPFYGVVPPNSKPVELAYGTQAYIDETDGLENIYYFIAASDAGGRRFDIFIPQTNTADVNTLAVQSGESSPDGTAAFSEQGISGINARVEGEGVIITYRAGSTEEQNAVLYRSGHAIRQPQDLMNAAVVQSGISSPFVDYPVPGTPWYYAIVFEDEIKSGSVQIGSGRNATVYSVEIPGGMQNGTRIRAMPLPSMTVRSAASESGSFAEIPQPVPLRAQTIKALENVRVVPLQKPPQKRPQAFTRDLETPAGGEDSGLMRIVQSSFSKREWESALSDLLNFLSLPHSADTEARARFYLGQALYFSGKYREALAAFLSVQSLRPAEANEWIEAVLAAMTR
jgi:hypothetical protein